MSFEETLVCDGCSRVIDGGPRGGMLRGLREQRGRAFERSGSAPTSTGWIELAADDPTATRHLCGNCAEDRVAFFDGVPVPASKRINRPTKGDQ